jgi:Replication-relaxation
MPSDASAQPHTPRLQPRDYALLRGLFECRMMTLAHATALYFEGRYEAASKRVQTLKSAGYIGDRRRRVGEPSLLYLTKPAFDRLTVAGKLADFPKLTQEQFAKRSGIKDVTLQHELSVMDVRVAITVAVNASCSHRVDEFTTWPLLHEFTAMNPTQRQKVPVRPDGFLRLIGDDDGEYHFFLELDRSNEVPRLLAEKALCYRDFYAKGGFALRCGGSVEQFREYPFRVLVILQNQERRNNLAERLMNCSPPVKFQTWLTTLSEVLADPLGKVWVCPLDYAHATANTAYAPEHWRGVGTYVRRPERERLVEERVQKRTLFEDAISTTGDSAV